MDGKMDFTGRVAIWYDQLEMTYYYSVLFHGHSVRRTLSEEQAAEVIRILTGGNIAV